MVKYAVFNYFYLLLHHLKAVSFMGDHMRRGGFLIGSACRVSSSTFGPYTRHRILEQSYTLLWQIVILLLRCSWLAPGVWWNWLPDHGIPGYHVTRATMLSHLCSHKFRGGQQHSIVKRSDVCGLGLSKPWRQKYSRLPEQVVYIPLLLLVFMVSWRIIYNGLMMSCLRKKSLKPNL